MAKSSKLGKKPSERRQADIEIPLAKRERVAEAVHRAVCEVFGGDGFGRCLPYAFAGAMLLHEDGFSLQAGSITIVADPDTNHPDGLGAVKMECRGDGFGRGEYHCWVGRLRKDGIVELVDFASRHYRTYVENMMTVTDATTVVPHAAAVYQIDHRERIQWTREDPPSFYWIKSNNPDRVPMAMFEPCEVTLRAIYQVMYADPIFGELARAAGRQYGLLQRN